MGARIRVLPLVLLSLAALSHCEPLYNLITPNILRVDSEETVVLEAHGVNGNIDVEVKIYDFPQKKRVLYSSPQVLLNPENGYLATTVIKIPAAQMNKDVKINQYVYVEATMNQIKLEKEVLVSMNTGYIFIQTDKTIYTPGSRVLYRIFAAGHNLEPTFQTVQVELVNPDGIVVEKQLFSDQSGILSKNYMIPDIVNLGFWKIVAKYENAPQETYSTEFEVKEYVLPSFEVKVECPQKFYHLEDDNLNIRITANYLHGKPVQGNAYVLFGVLMNNEKKNIPSSLEKVQITDGEGAGKLTKDMLRSRFPEYKELLGQSIYVTVTVLTNTGSEMVEAEKTGIPIVKSPFKMAFTKTPQYFKPGLVYTCVVSVMHPDGSPAASVQLKTATPPGYSFITQEDGTAALNLNTMPDSSQLPITVNTADINLPEDRQASVSMVANAYKGHGIFKNYLHISIPQTEVIPGRNLQVTFYIRNENMDMQNQIQHFTYLVLNKGKIVKVGRQERLSGQTAISMSLPITPELIPSFRLVAYYCLQNGAQKEIVADSIWLDMQDTCMGTLKVSGVPEKAKREYQPGKPIKMKVTGDPGAKVGMVAVDKAVYVLNKRHKLSQSKIWDIVEKNDVGCTAGSGSNNAGVFNDAGLSFQTNSDKGNTLPRRDLRCAQGIQGRRRRSPMSPRAKAAKGLYSLSDMKLTSESLTCEQNFIRITSFFVTLMLGSEVLFQVFLLRADPFDPHVLRYWFFFVILGWRNISEEMSLDFEIARLNHCVDNIEFTHAISDKELPFLDVLINIEDTQIKTKVFRKETDVNNSLLFHSFHPQNLKNNLLVSQYMRIKRICSQEEDLKENLRTQHQRYKERGYPDEILLKAEKRVDSNSRENLLTQKPKKTTDRHVFVSKFSTSSQKLKTIINKHWDLLSNEDDFNGIFNNKPIFAYTRSKNLKELLLTPIRDIEVSNRGMKKCEHCVHCSNVITGKTLHHPHTGKAMELHYNGDCNSKNLIYYIKCPCGKIYVDQFIPPQEQNPMFLALSVHHKAIFPRPLNYRALQRNKARALRSGLWYGDRISLDSDSRSELVWWLNNLEAWNGKAIFGSSPEFVLESDASLHGWGACLLGQNTGGFWSPEESLHHINYLELTAGLYALMSFRNSLQGRSVLLKMDNMSAVAYINRLGGTRSADLSNLAKKLWMFCLEHKIALKAEYLPGAANSSADWNSRFLIDFSDWKLNPSVFRTLNQIWGPLDVDLFASRLTSQLPNYFSWMPDPSALAFNSFLQPWKCIRGYAFPPFAMIQRVLQKLQSSSGSLGHQAPITDTTESGNFGYVIILSISGILSASRRDGVIAFAGRKEYSQASVRPAPPESVDEDEYLTDEEVVSRSQFAESWLWQIYDLPAETNQDGLSSIELNPYLQDSITTWEVLAIGFSQAKGICVADPFEITVRKPFFIDLRLPYSVVRNEQVEIRAVLHNYIEDDINVRVELLYNEDICSSSSLEKRFQQYVDIKAESSHVIPFVIIPLKTGELEIEVKAAGVSFGDGVRKKLKVVPEGMKILKNVKSVILDPGSSGAGQNGVQKIDIEPVSLLDVVPNTQPVTFISVKGDIVGETVENSIDGANLKHLITVPVGCGEQNMITMTPAVIATHYLDKTNQWERLGVERRADAIKFIQQGYTQQLAYRKEDNSYAAFVHRPSSTWLTAYVVKVFAMADNLMTINKDILCGAVKWLILEKQKPDGLFQEDAPVIHGEMMGGSQGSEPEASLTAFVLIALAEAKDICTASISTLDTSIEKAATFLENRINGLKKVYSVTISSYALALVGRSKGDSKLMELSTGGTHWHDPTSKLYTIEATSYGLLALLQRRKFDNAAPVVQWLTEQRYYGGGYGSTQATIMVFQALSKYQAERPSSNEINMDVSLSFPKRSKSITWRINTAYATVAKTERTTINEGFTVIATGTGQGTLTVMTSYYAPLTDKSATCKKFDFNILMENAPNVKRPEGTISSVFITICMRFLGNTDSTMTILDVSMLTGFTPDVDDLDKLTNRVDKYISKYEMDTERSDRGSLIIYLDKVSNTQMECIKFKAHQEFEVGLLQPAAVTIYEYYSIENRCTKFYHPSKESGLLRTICKEDACRCVAEKCSLTNKYKLPMDYKARLEAACEAGVDYVYLIEMLSMEEIGMYDFFTMKIVQVVKEGSDLVPQESTRRFISHQACRDSLKFNIGSKYLVWGSSTDLWDLKTEMTYLIGSKMWIEAVPPRCGYQQVMPECTDLAQFIQTLISQGCTS
ncbi:complement C3-like [Lissotriton helveticus]